MPHMRDDHRPTAGIRQRSGAGTLPVFMAGPGTLNDCTISPEGQLTEIGAPRAEPARFDADFAAQGLIDLQVNGFAGVDFNRPGITPEQVDRALTAMAATGVTTVLPTIITAPQHEIVATLLDLDAAVSASRSGR